MSIKLPPLLLRIGLALVFLYAATAALLHPGDWIGFIPVWARSLFPAKLLLDGFSFYQLILALWLIIGKKIFFAAILSALTVAGIIFANVGALDITFRDIAIFFSALALASLSYNRK